MSAAVQLEDVTKRYGAQEAVRNSASKSARADLRLLGPNGAGKTTTIRMLLGLGRADAAGGCWCWARLMCARRDQVGFLPEERGLYKRMTPVDAFAFFSPR